MTAIADWRLHGPATEARPFEHLSYRHAFRPGRNLLPGVGLFAFLLLAKVLELHATKVF